MLCVTYNIKNSLPAVAAVIKSFRNKKTAAVFDGERGDRKWDGFLRIAERKLKMVHAAAGIGDLRSPPNNRLEKLKGDRHGQYSIRINGQWRVCFDWRDGHAFNVEICDYH